MHVTSSDIRYGLYWRNKKGVETSITGFSTRRQAENHGAEHLTHGYIVHGYIQHASKR